jgi:hypothetical protein
VGVCSGRVGRTTANAQQRGTGTGDGHRPPGGHGPHLRAPRSPPPLPRPDPAQLTASRGDRASHCRTRRRGAAKSPTGGAHLADSLSCSPQKPQAGDPEVLAEPGSTPTTAGGRTHPPLLSEKGRDLHTRSYAAGLPGRSGGWNF